MSSKFDDDFITAAGLERSGSSPRKSAAEKRLEESLNTKPEPVNSKIVRQSSLTGTTSPTPTKTNSVSNEARQLQKLQDDSFIKSAGLQRISQSRRKSSAERLLEESLKTVDISIDENVSTNEVSYTISPKRESPTQEAIRNQTPSNLAQENITKQTPSSSAPEATRSQTPPSSERRDSIYKMKNIDMPTTVKGSRISSRTQNLFKQYEKDMSTRCIDSKKEQTNKELQEVQMQYQNSVLQNEQEIDEARKERIRNYAERTIMAM